uniref:RING-type domain-containing protein n=1 Tax=Panagrolaimus sp. ES5 TaxID=591445 RepID=A0AC34F3I7_9BILA
MIILPSENGNTETPGLQILQINGDSKNVEQAASVVQNILEEDGKKKFKRVLPKQNAKEPSKDGAEFECPICCEKYNIKDDGCVTCVPADIFETSIPNENHSICVSCIQDYARSSITGRVAPGGLGLNCVADGCKNVFLLSLFENYLNDEIRKPFLTRLQEQCVLETNLKDLVTCPGCGYKACVPETDTFYVCECGRKQCRSCPRPYDKKHDGKTCKQLADEEAREAKMSEIVVRKCHRCGTQFVKDDACNFMESCNEITRHGRCPNCGKTCRQWENDRELDQMRLEDFLRQNGVKIDFKDAGNANRELPFPSTPQELVMRAVTQTVTDMRNSNLSEDNPMFANMRSVLEFLQREQNQ